MPLDGGEARGEFFNYLFEACDTRVRLGGALTAVAPAGPVFVPLVASFGHKSFVRALRLIRYTVWPVGAAGSDASADDARAASSPSACISSRSRRRSTRSSLKNQRRVR